MSLVSDPPDRARQGAARTRSPHSVRPTPVAVLIFSLSVPVALLVVLGLPAFWYAALYLPITVLVCMAADLSMALPDRRLKIDCRAPARLYMGQRGAIQADLEARGGIRPTRMEALPELRGETEPPLAVSGLLNDGRLTLRPAVVPLRRGRVLLPALWLRWRGPLGLVELRRRQALNETVDVVPDVHGIHEEALRFFARDAVFGMKSQRMKGEGVEFNTLCEYAPGMDNRFIDWKRSARHRKLLCKEFMQERNHQVVLGFDTGRLMLEPLDGLPKLDRAIRAGLLLAWVSLRHGDLVGGCGFDVKFRHFLQPGRGMLWFSQFQRFTAGLDYQTEETNFTLGLSQLGARLQRRALIVLFTEFVDAISAELLLESLQWLARRHVVVFVTMRDPLLGRLQQGTPRDFAAAAGAVLADDMLRDRAVVLERVARLGVHCLDVPAPEISTALLNRYLAIKQRGLL